MFGTKQWVEMQQNVDHRLISQIPECICAISHYALFYNRNVHVHISATKCCIVGYGTDAFWDFWDGLLLFFWVMILVMLIAIPRQCGLIQRWPNLGTVVPTLGQRWDKGSNGNHFFSVVNHGIRQCRSSCDKPTLKLAWWWIESMGSPGTSCVRPARNTSTAQTTSLRPSSHSLQMKCRWKARKISAIPQLVTQGWHRWASSRQI